MGKTVVLISGIVILTLVILIHTSSGQWEGVSRTTVGSLSSRPRSPQTAQGQLAGNQAVNDPLTLKLIEALRTLTGGQRSQVGGRRQTNQPFNTNNNFNNRRRYQNNGLRGFQNHIPMGFRRKPRCTRQMIQNNCVCLTECPSGYDERTSCVRSTAMSMMVDSMVQCCPFWMSEFNCW